MLTWQELRRSSHKTALRDCLIEAAETLSDIVIRHYINFTTVTFIKVDIVIEIDYQIFIYEML